MNLLGKASMTAAAVLVLVGVGGFVLWKDAASRLSAGADAGVETHRVVGSANLVESTRSPGASSAPRNARPASAAHPPAASPAAQMLQDLEMRLLPGDALGLEAAQALMESQTFDRLAREVAWTYASDPDAYRAKRLLGPKLERFLSENAANLTTLECGQRYCLGAIRGNLAQTVEDGLGDAVGAGTFAVLPWADDAGQGYRFVFSTDPAVREVEGVLAGG